MRATVTAICFCLLLLPAVSEAQTQTSRHPVYDDEGRVAVLITYSYDSSGVVESRQLQSFDNAGKLRRTELYTADEHLLFTEDIRYDCHGNRRRYTQTLYDEEGHATRHVYRYRYKRVAGGGWRLVSIRLKGRGAN